MIQLCCVDSPSARRDLRETCRRYLDGFPVGNQLHLWINVCIGIRAAFTRFSGSRLSLLPLFARGMREAGCIMRIMMQEVLLLGVGVRCDDGGGGGRYGDAGGGVGDGQT